MATIRDVQVIYDEMLLKNLALYKVFDNDGKTLLTSQSDKEMPPATAVKMLTEFLSKLDGIVFVVISHKAGDEVNKGGDIRNQTFRYQVKVGEGIAAPIAGTGSAGTGSFQIALNQVEEKFNAKLEAMQKEYEHKEEIRKKDEIIADLKNGDAMKEKGLSLLEQLLSQGTTPGVAGVPNNSASDPGITGIGNIPPADRSARLQNALKKIASRDQDYIENLEIFANIAINKPLVYWEAIKKLKEY